MRMILVVALVHRQRRMIKALGKRINILLWSILVRRVLKDASYDLDMTLQPGRISYLFVS